MPLNSYALQFVFQHQLSSTGDLRQADVLLVLEEWLSQGMSGLLRKWLLDTAILNRLDQDP